MVWSMVTAYINQPPMPNATRPEMPWLNFFDYEPRI